MSRLIDADALKDYVLSEGLLGSAWSSDEREADVLSMIDDAPTVDPVKRGEWAMRSFTGCCHAEYREEYTCSCCNKIISWAALFCPHCGADMRAEAEP